MIDDIAENNIENETSSTGNEEEKEIAGKTARAVIWNYFSFGLGKGMVFVSTAILARLLTPHQFGLVGFATLTISYLSVFQDLGLGAALIQRRDDIEKSADTVFTMNLLLGALLTTITILIAPFVATYFRNPEVTNLLRVLGFTFVLNALVSTHIIRLQRQLAFNRKIVPDFGRSMVKGLVSIALALSGFGIWSLVLGQLAGVLTAVILGWIVFPWRPRLHIHRALARTLLVFGSTMLVDSILFAVINSADYLIIGRKLGDNDLGIYTLAYRLPELLVMNLLWVVSAAIFPAYASIQDNPDLLRQGFLTTLRYIEMISIPLCLGLFIAADPLVRVAFGHQWLEAIPIVRILTLFVLVYSIGSNAGDIYKANGRPDVLVKLGLIGVVPMVAALLYGVRFGLIGVAIAHLVMGTLRMLLNLFVTTHMINVRWRDIAIQIKPAFISGLTLLLLALPVAMFTVDMRPLPRLMLIAIAGVIGYVPVLWLQERAALQQVFKLVLKRG